MSLIQVAVVIACAGLAPALLAQSSNSGSTPPVAQGASAGSEVGQGVASSQGASRGSSEEGRHELRTGDRLRFRIEEDPATGKEPILVAVNSVGEASFPVSRESDIRVTLPVRGKTLKQVREQLAARLLEDYYHRATVELNLEEKTVTPGKVQFFGEMSGTIPILPDHPPMFLSEQILQMGVPDFANLRRVKVHRIDPVTQTSKIIEVDVRSIIRGGERSKDVLLQDGDRVEVLQKLIN
jgi:protein involved in polysaccharide export with SLBB domain